MRPATRLGARTAARRLAAFIFIVLVCTLAAAILGAEPARDPGLTVLQSLDTSPDSLKYLLRWPVSADARGMADSYTLQVTTSKTGATFIVNRTGPTLVDSVTVGKPAWGDSISFTAKVKATRRTKSSAFASVTWKYVRVDSAPPVPAPITVDSSQVPIARADVRPIIVALAERDSVQLCAFVTLADGTKAMTEQADAIAECHARFTQYLAERSL